MFAFELFDRQQREKEQNHEHQHNMLRLIAEHTLRHCSFNQLFITSSTQAGKA
jgi:hypothetical protein